MTPARIAEIRALAEKATPGERTLEKAPMDAGFDIMHAGTNVAIASYLTERDAKYYAALDPQTVLALLASHDALQAEVEAMRAQIEASQTRRLEIGDDIKEKLAAALACGLATDAAQRMRERCAHRVKSAGLPMLAETLEALPLEES